MYRKHRHPALITALTGLLWLTGGATGANADIPSTNAAAMADSRQLCGEAIARSERDHALPAQLLKAISLAESGRWDAGKGEKFAWPWTVMSGGQGRFFPTKAIAIAYVRDLQQQGVRNIDVGCMQVNLGYHPDAFADLETAFDPAANADYASRFLRRLHARTKSWSAALRRYHSADYQRSSRYLARVIPLWNNARTKAAQAKRQAVIAAFQERRALQLAQRQAGQ